MAALSSVKKLPPEIREEIGALRERGVTIDEIMVKLRELGAEVSRSAVGRYVKEIGEVGERLRRSREIAEVLVKRLGDAPESRQARLNIELMHTVVLDLIMSGQDGEPVTLDPEQVMFIGRTLKDLASAQKADAELALRVRKELAAEQDKKLKHLETEAGKGGASRNGLDPATLKRVREEIYGIVAR